jgi:hypothetical protein
VFRRLAKLRPQLPLDVAIAVGEAVTALHCARQAVEQAIRRGRGV